MVSLNSDAIVLNIEENLVQVKISVIMMYELDKLINQFQKLKYALFKFFIPFEDVFVHWIKVICHLNAGVKR